MHPMKEANSSSTAGNGNGNGNGGNSVASHYDPSHSQEPLLIVTQPSALTASASITTEDVIVGDIESQREDATMTTTTLAPNESESSNAAESFLLRLPADPPRQAEAHSSRGAPEQTGLGGLSIQNTSAENEYRSILQSPRNAPLSTDSSPFSSLTPPIVATNQRETVFGMALSRVIWTGQAIFHGMERIGEGVVHVLGLDQSRYQDMLDGMTEEEMKAAQEVLRQRQLEDEEMDRLAKVTDEQHRNT